jgi:hypothetical protein
MRKYTIDFKFESKFMESYATELWQTLISLSKLLKERSINFTIIGGSARNQYGYSKITEDIDLLVAKEDKDKMLSLPIGYIRELSHGRGKVFKFHNPETKVEVIYEGEVSGDGKRGLEYVSPEKISNDIRDVPFLTLKKLIEYKLSSGLYGHMRMKDFDDIYELIRRNNLPETYADVFRDDLKVKYLDLWNSAQTGNKI